MRNLSASPQSFLRHELSLKLAQLKSRNRAYSLRSFAIRLGIPHPALSEFLNGKRSLSDKMALGLALKANLNPEKIATLKDGFSDQQFLAQSKPHKESGREDLPLDLYYVVAEWPYYAVLSLASLNIFKGEPEWVAQRLGISPKRAKSVLKRLEVLKYLKRNSKKELIHGGRFLKTTDGISNLSLRARHEENLDSAKEALFKEPLERRDFSFVTVAADPSKLPIARKLIRAVQDKICDLFATGDASEVYEICCQIFPRTNIARPNIDHPKVANPKLGSPKGEVSEPIKKST